MKYYLFIFLLFSIITITPENYLKPKDYELCEYNPNTPEDGKDCNSRWTPDGDNGGIYGNENGKNINNTVSHDYRCCYVEYSMGSRKKKSCYLLQDSKTHRSKFKNRVLHQFDDVKIKCDCNFVKFSALVFAVLFSLIL